MVPSWRQVAWTILSFCGTHIFNAISFVVFIEDMHIAHRVSGMGKLEINWESCVAINVGLHRLAGSRSTCMYLPTLYLHIYLIVLRNPHCRRFCTSSKDGTVRVWDTQSKRCEFVLSQHTDAISCVKWSGEGLIYTASRDRTIKVWDAKDVRFYQLPPTAIFLGSYIV
jgi:hypothetical protein